MDILDTIRMCKNVFGLHGYYKNDSLVICMNEINYRVIIKRVGCKFIISGNAIDVMVIKPYSDIEYYIKVLYIYAKYKRDKRFFHVI